MTIDIASMSRQQLEASATEISRYPQVRIRAIAARRWCKLRYPDDEPETHKEEAHRLFGGDAPLGGG